MTTAIIIKSASFILGSGALWQLLHFGKATFDSRLQRRKLAFTGVEQLREALSRSPEPRDRILVEQAFETHFQVKLPYRAIEFFIRTSSPSEAIRLYSRSGTFIEFNYAATMPALKYSRRRSNWQKKAADFGYYVLGLMSVGGIAGAVRAWDVAPVQFTAPLILISLGSFVFALSLLRQSVQLQAAIDLITLIDHSD